MRGSRWLLAALAAASIRCGGEEADPPTPDPLTYDGDGDGVVRAQDCDDARRTAWQLLPGFQDADGDGRGAGAVTQVCSGAALPGGWVEDGTDCDDAASTRWAAFEAYADPDGDGVGAGPLAGVCRGDALPYGWSEVGGDCAPDDGGVWHELPFLYRDADRDSMTVASAGVVCAGAALPAGYANDMQGDDCDDADATRWFRTEAYRDGDGDGQGGDPGTACAGAALPPGWVWWGGDCDDGDARYWTVVFGYPDADRDGRGGDAYGSACGAPGLLPEGWKESPGDCDDADPRVWATVYYAYVDRDGDGATPYDPGSLCTDGSLPNPYRESLGWRGGDCDDADADAWAAVSGYVDGDVDGVGEGERLALCTTGSLPEGHVATGGDCAPGDPARWRAYVYTWRDADGDGRYVYEAGSVCFGEVLPAGYATSTSAPADCDDAEPAVWAAVSGYADADGDGVGAGARETFCTGGALPADRVAAGTDCAADDATRWQSLAYAGSDADGDGFTTRVAGAVCAGAALPEPFRAAVAGNDCADGDTALWRWVVLYPDADGDGVGAPPREITCLGTTVPPGWSEQGWDANDLDPGVQVLAGEADPLAEGEL